MLLRSIVARLKSEDVRLQRLAFQELGWCLCKSGNSLCGLDYFSKAREAPCLLDYINFVACEGAPWVSVVQDRFMEVSSCVKNKAVVICQEDSIGQTLKQLRYASLLLEEGAVEVGVISDHFSEDLFTNSELCVSPCSLNDIGQFDLIALPSLLFAKYCKRPGFLTSEKFLNRNVMRCSDFSGRITVGVTWRSDCDSNGLCSFPINLLKNLFDLDFVNLLACQIGPLDQTEKEFLNHYRLRNIVDGCGSYGVLADRILENVDVMICVDSTPLHLAGALGVPVLGMLSANPDWRWFAPDGFASYTSCELHFQKKLGDWSNSLVGMVDYLSGFFENRNGRSNLSNRIDLSGFIGSDSCRNSGSVGLCHPDTNSSGI